METKNQIICDNCKHILYCKFKNGVCHYLGKLLESSAITEVTTECRFYKKESSKSSDEKNGQL